MVLRPARRYKEGEPGQEITQIYESTDQGQRTVIARSFLK
jgi:hypothetical protein